MRAAEKGHTGTALALIALGADIEAKGDVSSLFINDIIFKAPIIVSNDAV